MPARAVKEFLSKKHVKDLVVQGELETLRTSSTVYDALHALDTKKVLSAPVLDLDDEYAGCLSVNDILRDLIAMLDDDQPGWLDLEGSIDSETLSFLARKFFDRCVKDLAHVGELWLLEAGDTSTLHHLVVESLESQAIHAHHRVFLASPSHGEGVCNHSGIVSIQLKAGEHSKDGTGLKIVGVVSQSDIVKLLWDARDELTEALAKTLEDVDLQEGPVYTVPATTSTLHAFGFMARDHLSAIAVVDSNNALLANLSASDLRGLTAEDFPLLLLPVPEFLLVKSGKAGVTREDALGGARVPDAASRIQELLPLDTVSPSATLGDVVHAVTQHHHHRVYVVGEDGKATAVVSLTDVLRVVTKE